jgi:Glyoxalase-like domain
MTSRISHTTVDCGDAFALSEWWKLVLDYDDVAGDPNEAGDEECMIVDSSTGHQVLFIEVSDPKATKNRIHFDLQPVNLSRDQEIERLLQLGATEVADRRTADGGGWMTMADLEGNEFCVVRSQAEYNDVA